MTFRKPAQEPTDLPPIKGLFGSLGGTQLFNKAPAKPKYNASMNTSYPYRTQLYQSWYQRNKKDIKAWATALFLIFGFFFVLYTLADHNLLPESCDGSSWQQPCNGRRIHGYQNGHYVNLCIDN